MKYDIKNFAKAARESRSEYRKCVVATHLAAKGCAPVYKIIDRV